MSTATDTPTVLDEPVGARRRLHIQAGDGRPGKPGLCGVVNVHGTDRGPWTLGAGGDAGADICDECELIALERYGVIL